MTPLNIATVSLEPGVTLIEASAGTGKTYSITGLILRLVVEMHVPIREILTVTFTEAATEELRERVRRHLQTALEDLRRGRSKDPIVAALLKSGEVATGIRELDAAVQSFDEAQIFTIHAFCQRMLNDYAFESGARFDTVLQPDPKPLFQEIARDFWRLRFYEASPLLPTLALGWTKSPNNWAQLLEQTRRHPDLVVIPSAETRSCDELLRDVELALAVVEKGWRSHRAQIEKILYENPGLSRAKGKFSETDVSEMIAIIGGARRQSEQTTPESIAAIRKLSSEAIAAGTKPTGVPPSHPFFALCTAFCRATETLFRQVTHEFLEFAEAELPKRKTRTNTVTYDDLITGLRNALKNGRGEDLARAIGAHYSTALIDEFQDTDPAQLEIFRAIFGSKSHRLFLIGDPKQAVYGFRGADIFTYFEASKLADRRFTLDTNWRSEERLLAGINTLFLEVEAPFIFPQIQYHKVHAPPEPKVTSLTSAGDVSGALRFRLVSLPENQGRLNQDSLTELMSECVSADVDALQNARAFLGDRPVHHGDMAVLVRKHKQADEIQRILWKRGIRSIVQSDQNVFASPEAQELQEFLQGVIDPRRDHRLKAALATPLMGFDAQELFALDHDDKKRQVWLDRFSDWRQQWTSGCFIAMFRRLLVFQDVRARLVQLPAGERRLTNFLHLAELLHEAESTRSLTPDAVCSWLREQRDNKQLSEDRFQLRLETDGDAVQIVTIHKCKGLEYPIVFCPFLWLPPEFQWHKELQFHDRDDPKKRLTFDLRDRNEGDQKHRDWQSEEANAEELRLLYVAVTRAKNRCYIYLPDKRIDKSPLAQLFPPPVDGKLINQVIELAQSSNGSIDATSPEPGERKDALPRVQGLATARPSGDKSPASETLKARSFRGKISRVAMTASFSRLNAVAEQDEVNSDLSSDANARIEPESDDSDLSIFTFDRGRRTGDFFHDVLEQMDFQNTEGLSKLIEEKLWAYGFPQTLHQPAINQILQELMEVQLEPGVSLRAIPRHERLSELEFSHPLAHLTPASLAKVIGKCAITASDVRTRMGALRFDPVEGFMRGFIDLLFRFKDRFFVVDWKSNWLGSQPADYGQEGMRLAMLEHNYYLQYHLYTLAADLFLEKRAPGYDYQTHFGGIYYIFLRGIDPKDTSRGIFRDRPAVETVRMLRSLIA